MLKWWDQSPSIILEQLWKPTGITCKEEEHTQCQRWRMFLDINRPICQAARSPIMLEGVMGHGMLWCVILFEAARVLESYQDLRSQLFTYFKLDLLFDIELGYCSYWSEYLIIELFRQLTEEIMSLQQLAHEEATPYSSNHSANEADLWFQVLLKYLAKRINQV